MLYCFRYEIFLKKIYFLYRYKSKKKKAPSNKKAQKQIEKLHTKIKKDLEEFQWTDSNLIYLNYVNAKVKKS